MTTLLRVLIVEDSERDAELLVRHLRLSGFDVDWLRVDTAEAMAAALRQREWDIVIADYTLSAFSAPEAAALLREQESDVPFILVSGTVGEDIAVTALKAGAHDFLTKRNLTRLAPAIDRELRDTEERRKRRQAERELSETRERMSFALEAAGVGTWEWDVATDTVVWSELLERIHGLKDGAFRGTFDAFIETMHPDDQPRVRGTRATFLATPTHSRIEYRVTWPDGSLHWIASTGRAFFDAAGGPVRAAGISVDVTEQRRLQDRLVQSQKMESIGNLAGGIAHDFNNLLTAMSGYCELLADRPGLEPAVLQDLDEVRRAVASAAVLTRQLLAFSRKQLLAPQIVSLNDVASNLAPVLRRLIEENVTLDVRLAPDLARVNVDPGQIEQVLMNLAANARDAMPDGGTLIVETANLALGRGSRSGVEVPPGPYVLLSVSDTGTGMSPEVQRHLFEPFFTTKPKGHGTGLGLATVYGIVKQSEGYVFVHSEAGKGTTFQVYFPVASGATGQTDARRKETSGDLHGSETILVVEDDPRLRALDDRILTRCGYRVLLAMDVAEAKRLCTEHEGPIHVVLTDVIMPGGSGRTIGDWVSEHRAEAKVIFMSGYSGDAIARHGVLEPGVHFLQKPFSPEVLARKVREVLS